MVNLMKDSWLVSSYEELETLNEDEILEGYLKGIKMTFIQEENCSKSFLHGYYNGLCDASETFTQKQKDLIKSIKKSGNLDHYLNLLREFQSLIEKNKEYLINNSSSLNSFH